MNLGEIFKKLGLGKRHLFFALLSVFVTFFTISIWAYELNNSPKTQAGAATCYWVGDAPDSNWDDITHWSSSSGGGGSTCDDVGAGGTVPTTDTTVVFDNLNANSVNVNAAVSVAAITNTNYVGTFTTNANTVAVSGNVQFRSGTLNLGTNIWTVGGNFDLWGGGTIVASDSTLIMTGSPHKIIYPNNQTFKNIRFSGDTHIGASENTDTNNFYVSGTLTVDNTKTLAFLYRTHVYMNNGSTTALSGTMAEGSGGASIHFIDSAGANLSTGGTLSVKSTFETATGNITIPARNYGDFEVVNATVNDYVATLGTLAGQTISTGYGVSTGNIYVTVNGDGDLTLDGATYDPNVNDYASTDSSKGRLDFGGTGAGAKIINAGDGTWLVDGTIDFTGGTFNANSSTVYSRVDGTQNPTFTMAGSSFYNFTINNPDTNSRVFTFADNVTVANTLTMTAVDYAFTVRFTAGITCIANTIDIDGVAGKLITLKSVTDTSQWYFNVLQAMPTASYVSVRDSNADGGSDIRATNSTDATGNSSWIFLTSAAISGTVYTDVGNIGAGKTIGISVQGAAKTTVESGAGGTFSFTVNAAAGDAITIFEDGEGAEEMTLVTQTPTPLANVTGLEAYTNKVVLTHASAGPMTNTIMDYADSTFDDDIKYTVTGGNVDFVDDFEMWVEAAKTYTPGGTVDVDDVDINGTFTMAANAVAVHGNWDATGGGYTSSGTVTMDGATAQTITSDGDSFYNLTISNTHASGVVLADTLSLGGNFIIAATGANAVLFNANTSAVNVIGNISMTMAAAGIPSISMGTNTWTVTGNITLTNGTITAGGSTLILNGTTALTSASQIFNNVQLGTAGIGGSLTLSDTGHIDGTFTIQNGGDTTLILTNQTLTISSAAINFTNLDNFTVTNSTLLLDGAVAQTLTSASKSLNNLTIKTTHASGAILADALSVGGNLYLSADGASNVLLDAATNSPAVSVTGNVDFTGAGGGVEDIHMGNNTWTAAGNITLTDGTIDAGLGTLALNGTTALTSASNFFNNVQIGTAGAGGSLTTNDTTDINGTLTVTNFAATTLNVSDDTVSFASTVTLTNLDTFTTTNSTAVFDGTTALTSATLAFNNVQIGSASAGGSLSTADNMDINGTLAVTNFAATTFNIANDTIYFASTVTLTNLDVFTTTSSTAIFDGTTSLTSASLAFNNVQIGTAGLGGSLTLADNADFNGDLTVGNGAATTFVISNRILNFGGENFTLTNLDIFTVANSTVIFDHTALDVVYITSNNLDFNNIDFNDAGGAAAFWPLDAMDINGTFTLDDGALNLDPADPTINIAGNITINGGTITKSGAGAPVTFDGDLTYTDNVGNINFGNIQIGTSPDTTILGSSLTCDHLTVKAGDTLTTAGYNIDSSGTITIEVTGTLNATTVGGRNSAINLAGNWLNSGIFTLSTSTVILDGNTAQLITASGQSFNNLTIANTDATNGVTFADPATVSGTFADTIQDSKITFNAGGVYAFNTLNVAGTAGHLVNFISSTPGTPWLFNITEASPTADYVSATDSNAFGGSTIDATTGGFNGGGNTNWLFAVAMVTVSPSSATLDQGATQAFTATAADSEGFNVPTAIFTWSVASGGGTITLVGVFTAGTTAGTFSNTIQATSGGINGYASVTVNAGPTPPTPIPEPTPSGDTCTLGSITQIEIQDNVFSLNPGDTKTLGVNFLDATGNAIHRDSVANFKITPDYSGSYWNIGQGGGRLADENLDTINNNFIAGGTRGSFSGTIAFSACGGALKAYATPTIIKQKTIYADMEPESYALQPGESFEFHVSLFDDIQVPVEESCSYSWSVSDPAAAKIESPANNSTRVTANNNKGEYTLKVDANCSSGSASATAALAVVTIDENTEYKLTSYFPSLVSWEGQKTYVGFIPYIKAFNKWYYRAENLDFAFSDPSAAKVVGLHSVQYPSIPIIESMKAGCYPFLVQATLNKFGKSYQASTSMNIGASQSSGADKYQPTLGNSTLSFQHMVKVAGEVRLNLNRNNASGQSYSNYNWIYVGKSMDTSWIVNDTRVGTIRPYYNASYLDTSNAQYGYFPNAITTVVNFNGKKKIENWNIWIERTSDKVTFSPSVPDTIRVKPNSYFRGVWQGYEYANWKEKIENVYRLRSFNADAVSLINGVDAALLFKSGAKEGTYKDAIVLGSAYGTASMVGGTERKITVIVDNTATTDLCSASAFAQVSGSDKSVGPGESADKKSGGKKSISDILRDIWNAIVAAIVNAFKWLNNNPFASLIISFLLALPALLSILGTSVIGNTLSSVSRAFSALSVGAISGKKNRRLGYIYDYLTKKPIRGARVSAFATATGRAIYQTVTNSQGEFILFLPQGEYYLKVEKRGYRPYQTVPAENQQHFDGKRTDGYYESIYLPSEMLNIGKGQEDFAHAIAIPLMRPMPQENWFVTFLVKLGGWIIKASFYFLIAGTIMTIGLIIYDHSNIVNILIGVYYALVWFLYGYHHFTFFSGTAQVVDENGKALDLALIRVLNDQGKLIQTVVSDRRGRFILNLAKGNYMLRVSKSSYQMKEINLKVKSLADINRISVRLDAA